MQIAQIFWATRDLKEVIAATGNYQVLVFNDNSPVRAQLLIDHGPSLKRNNDVAATLATLATLGHSGHTLATSFLAFSKSS